MTPYASQTPADELGQTIGRLSVATLIPVFGLFILRLILASLPMIKNAGSIGDLGVTPLILVKASIDTVIYFLIVRFCAATNKELKARRPHLAEMGTVILLAGLALVATLAYSGYELLMASLAPAQMEVYNWVFLAVVLAPIAGIVVIVTRRLDFFTSLMFGKINDAVAQPAAYAAAGAASPAWAPPPAPAPAYAPPAEDPAYQQMRDRVSGAQQKVAAAGQAALRLSVDGKMNGELAESASKMQGYLDGAVQSLGSRDAAALKGFADWAEYEASRILAAAN